jgi:hypothetical protein
VRGAFERAETRGDFEPGDERRAVGSADAGGAFERVDRRGAFEPGDTRRAFAFVGFAPAVPFGGLEFPPGVAGRLSFGGL